ncbi:hypothetical protein DH2020_038551 [Rehmannia glutinosa]|uniref:Phosphatase PP2A regulatory subunit A/Splicing factor 3B subunit 1-like HEAT repeat domain-containing protein n=1 Tax=Rehmannia glutinosa TaxID=99300 RepID=A0ABR0UZG5_REHGL
MATVDEPIYPIVVLIDELKNEDIQQRLNSIRRLSTIARALGEERTRKELIPFLSENNDDDDEVLLAMAEELGNFIPYVGGVEHANVLLAPLEGLCSVEETCVREKAVDSLCRIGSQMRELDLVESFIPLVKRLAGGEWFTARVSSCGFFHIAYPSAPENLRNELRTIYSQLCQDDMPMVRRAAATNLGKFAATVEPSHLKTEIMSMFEDLTHDDQDSVRLLAVEGCASLGKLLEPQDCASQILPIIISFSQRVINFLHDCRNLLYSSFPELSSDSSQHVRSALASIIMGMAPILGKDATIEQLLPIFLSLLKDEFPDVRLNIISKLDQVNQVYSIREAAANNVKRLAEEFGPEWAMHHIIPQVLEMINDSHYLYRMTILNAISLLAPVMGSEITCSKLLPVIVSASKDRLALQVVDNTIRPCLVELSEDPDVDVSLRTQNREWLSNLRGLAQSDRTHPIFSFTLSYTNSRPRNDMSVKASEHASNAGSE